jgi:hypothetical protein
VKCTIELGLGGMICLPSFMKIGTGFQAILMFGLSSLSGCNAGTADGRDL